MMEVTKKQQASNEARLQSIKHRHEHYNHSKQIIQASLKNLNVSKKQHIFFDDDDESVVPIKKTKIESFPDISNGCEDEILIQKNSSLKKKKNALMSNDILGEKAQRHISKSRDPLNFKNGIEDFAFLELPNSKNSSKKQMALQEQVGNDKRFKIDKRFVESDNDEINSFDAKLSKKSNEVKANLAIFHKVVGPLTVANIGKQSVHFSDPSTKRYDPCVETETVLTSGEETTVLEPKPKKVKKNAPKVSKKQFYDVSTTDLKQAFAKTEAFEEHDHFNNKPFSFLSMLGRDHEEEQIVNDIANYKTEKFEKLNHIVSKLHSSKIFEYDSSDMSDSDVDENILEKIKSSDIQKSTDKEDTEKFFLLAKSDSKFDIAEKLSNRHKQDKDWNETRADVIEQCKNLFKNASMWGQTKKKGRK